MKVGNLVKICADGHRENAEIHPPGVIVGKDTSVTWFVLWMDKVMLLPEGVLEVINESR